MRICVPKGGGSSVGGEVHTKQSHQHKKVMHKAAGALRK